ncbi:alanine racemase [Bacillus pseudomycoides]|uniref:Alanine racemase n=1 Tax=Bacillus pseudomycoides TaxID=64104 RepID=A0A2B6JES8_9BACI|nr:alanine racemase [Bacillus pseudomycoides]PDY47315.1 alanine racemase [Bacillus pseudomycoides]PEA82281.1 alanine racemase [Bacillus pseudomycoides]PED06277.1 alanine racemase [Bacillus pseudomycoides]PED72113.1 alanine racemase [Bacillus pseudomycoides]PEI45597.1 alanine racemase [Bacillus pseudomycoides]
MSSRYGRDTIVEVNLDAVKHNVREFKKRVNDKNIAMMAAVKANGYGHGAVEVAKAAIEAGVNQLAVAFVDEGIELREAGVTVPILVLGYTPVEVAKDAIGYDIMMTVYRIEDLKGINEIAKQLEKKAHIQVKIDTGMSRIGLQEEEVAPFLEELKNMKYIEIEGMFTHYSTADEINKIYTNMQTSLFEKAVNTAKEMGIHLPYIHSSNSAGSMELSNTFQNMVRVGIGIYGMYPSKEVDHTVVSLQPALSLKSKVAHIKHAKKNRGVSYGNTYVTTGEEWIATVPIGYADGYNRQLSNKGHALINGIRVPVLGRVCMDQLMLDVTKAMPVQVGDEVVFYGRQGEEEISVEEIADTLGTINYEVTCMLDRRIPRVYKENDETTTVVNILRNK